jgi:murein L,D-transpeptidase YafK
MHVRTLFIIVAVFCSSVIAFTLMDDDEWKRLSPSERVADLKRRCGTEVTASLLAKNLKPGDPVYLRAIKQSSEVEVWMKASDALTYTLYKVFPVARWSGTLGPKEKEGDRQAPEGCYGITRALMHPGSSYHLAMNIGYPNELDRAHGRTGNLIMIHGKNVSVGCFAMTDAGIEEIYFIIDAALDGGQMEVPVHCFPFRMTEENMLAASAEFPQWLPFWRDVRAVWEEFETTKLPPRVVTVDKRYRVVK